MKSIFKYLIAFLLALAVPIAWFSYLNNGLINETIIGTFTAYFLVGTIPAALLACLTTKKGESISILKFWFYTLGSGTTIFLLKL